MANTPDEIIRSFCAKWADGNVKEIVNYFDENAIYHNIPMAPVNGVDDCLLYTSPSPRDLSTSRMPSSA